MIKKNFSYIVSELREFGVIYESPIGACQVIRLAPTPGKYRMEDLFELRNEETSFALLEDGKLVVEWHGLATVFFSEHLAAVELIRLVA